MGEEEGCGNRKSDVASLRKKLKLHLLVYIIDFKFFTRYGKPHSTLALGFD